MGVNTLWFWVRKGSPSTQRECRGLTLDCCLFSVLAHPAPKQSPGSRARAGRSLKLSGRKLITGASFPRWGKRLMLYFLFPPFGPKTDIVVGRVAREPEKGRLRNQQVLGPVSGGRTLESDCLRLLWTAGLTPKLWIHGSDPNSTHRLWELTLGIGHHTNPRHLGGTHVG